MKCLSCGGDGFHMLPVTGPEMCRSCAGGGSWLDDHQLRVHLEAAGAITSSLTPATIRRLIGELIYRRKMAEREGSR